QANILSLNLYTLVDDFDVLWLNNQDSVVHMRPGFPAIDVDTNGYSGGGAVGDASVEGPFPIDKYLLNYGVNANLACAKVFKVNATSSDGTFAHQLVAVVTKWTPPGPTITIQNPDPGNPNNVKITWTPIQDFLYQRSVLATNTTDTGWSKVSPQNQAAGTA